MLRHDNKSCRLEMKHTLGTTEYNFDMPASFCAVWDVFYMISTNPNRAIMGRLFAAIIGLTIKGAQCPKYSLSAADPVQYGGLMQEWLHSIGVGPIQVLSIGSQIFTYLSEHIPTNQEVEEAGNF